MRTLQIWLFIAFLGLTACSPAAPPAATPLGDTAPTAMPTPLPATPTIRLSAAPSATATPTEPIRLSATPSAAATPTIPLSATPSAAPSAAALQARILAAIPTPASGDPFSTFAGVNVFQPDPANPALWVAHTTGSRAYDPLLPHFIEIYAYEQGDWQLRGHLDLELADFLYAESMRRVSMPDGQLWLEFNSGIGAHGGCYDLLRFDGAALTPVVNHCHSSPLASGGVHDANQDGAPDLILNQTIDYVFCYACGVRIPMFRVLTFAEGSWQEVPLRLAGADVPEAVRQANDTAVSHAQAGLWQSASALIAPLETADPVVRWNQVLIALHVYDLQAMVAAGAYPLLNQLFYGDYAAALDVLRPFAPAQLFSPPAQNPLIAETVAQGWETDLATYVQTYADLALGVHPDLAAAYFLRGWAAYLLAPGDAAAVADIQQAAALAPDDPLLTAAAAFVTP